MKTLKESTEYVYNYIKNYNPENWEEFSYDDIVYVLEEKLIDYVGWLLSENEKEEFIENGDDKYLDNLLSTKLWTKYPIILQAITNDVLNHYVLSDYEDNTEKSE